MIFYSNKNATRVGLRFFVYRVRIFLLTPENVGKHSEEGIVGEDIILPQFYVKGIV